MSKTSSQMAISYDCRRKLPRFLRKIGGWGKAPLIGRRSVGSISRANREGGEASDSFLHINFDECRDAQFLFLISGKKKKTFLQLRRSRLACESVTKANTCPACLWEVSYLSYCFFLPAKILRFCKQR